MDYRYWLIRYVPDIARGEFTNVGILCGRDGGDWAVRFDTRSVRNHGRLSSDLHELRPWMAWFTQRIEHHDSAQFGVDPVSVSWITHLRTRQADSVQFSEPSVVSAESAAAGVALLFPHLVQRDTVPRARTLTRSAMRSAVRGILTNNLGLIPGHDLFTQTSAVIGKQRSTFDFLRRDHQIDALSNVWAFNAGDVERLEQQVQAANYFLTRLRADGAQIRLGAARTINVAGDVPVSVIYDPPTSPRERQWRTDTFEAALEAWNLQGVKARSLDDFRTVTVDDRPLAPASH